MPITAVGGKYALALPVLRNMFEARKQVFVDLLKWNVPVVEERYEIDQFDNIHATYLILTDKNGGHHASCRLLPTTRAHILGSLFPQLCTGPVPEGPDIFEITRFCLDRSLSSEGRKVARNRLVSEIVDHAIQQGISCYTGVAELNWFHQVQDFGWKCVALGPSRRIEGRAMAGLSIMIDGKTIASMRAAGIYCNDDAVLALPQVAGGN
ncbi:MAG: acyl-homoserine-lactone synthase [Sphingorhabdus sp.]